MSVRLQVLSAAAAVLLGGCAHFDIEIPVADNTTQPETLTSSAGDSAPKVASAPVENGSAPVIETGAVSERAWGEPTVVPYEAADDDGPYLLDTGDRLRIFVYGQPNLSRLYIVDHEGRVAVPLIGEVRARGRTTSELQRAIRARLGAEFVKDPQVTVDVQQNRPFFILGEVKSAGQYPYVSGMTVETAVAIAGGFSERASENRFRITRRTNGIVEQIDTPGGFVVRPGDTVYVFERFF